MAEGDRQLRLLLWKDYLIRKRKLITVGGIIWTILVMLSLYAVRINVDNQDFPTCQYAARPLPSAGMLTFLQSFICNINNECQPMDRFQEVPTYENSRLTQMQRNFSPLLYNETILEVASVVPDALKLLGTASEAADEPTFLYISKYGLRIRDLFREPHKVKLFVLVTLNLEDEDVDALMDAEISFQGVMKGHTNKCNPESISETIHVKDEEVLKRLVAKICPLSDKKIQDILTNLMMEINFSKYIKMVGNMYSKLNGDTRIQEISDTLSAVLRMSSLQSFIPPELFTLLTGLKDEQFRYFNLTIITKVLDQFEPTFGGTEAYKTIRSAADAAISGIHWFYKLIRHEENSNSVHEVTRLVLGQVDSHFPGRSLNQITSDISNAADVFQQEINEYNALDEVFNVLPKILHFIMRWLPKNTKHDVLFYSTLLAKLIDGAHQVVSINMKMEEITYNASVRNPEGLKILVKLPISLVGKAFDALTDAERTQVMTSKLNNPNQMFCDVSRLQTFFVISKENATSLKEALCTDAWKKYVNDLITSFGIYEVKNKINAMASLLIQETLGKDTSEQLYTIEQDLEALKNFIQALIDVGSNGTSTFEWAKMLNVSEDSEWMTTVRNKSRLWKQILITVHGNLAKEIVKQNTILNLKITPILIDITSLVVALNGQLAATPKEPIKELKKMYPVVIETMLRTLKNEEKTYKLLSTHSIDIFCNGTQNVSNFIELPSNDSEDLLTTLCRISNEIEDGLSTDSIIGKTISTLTSPSHKTTGQVNWNLLINGIKILYTTLREEHPYLFEFTTYNMNIEEKVLTAALMEEVKEYWFGITSLSRSLHLSISSIFRVLDLLDRDMFNISNDIWNQFKFSLNSANGVLVICDEIVKLIDAVLDENYEIESGLPLSTVIALKRILPNIPHLIVDGVNLIRRSSLLTNITAVISLMNASPQWPCSSTSLSVILNISRSSADAVRGCETLMCMDKSMRQEWEEYGALQKVRLISSFNKSNSITYEAHLFLKFSYNFDALVKDAAVLQKTLGEVLKDDSTDLQYPSFVRAIKYATEVVGSREGEDMIRTLTSKIDSVLNSIESNMNESVSLNALWERYVKCTNAQSECSDLGRTTWKQTLKFVSVMLESIAEDLVTYVKEVNEPNANLIQIMGFTRDTGLYILYDKIADFVGVLLNSYFDYGFMTQIRRASKSSFWDCDSVVDALVIPAGSRISNVDLVKVKHYVCPSLLYWVSLPQGENTLLDVISKPQYYFYATLAENLDSHYEFAFDNILELIETLNNVAKKNITEIIKSDIDINTISYKYNKLIDEIFDWKLEENDTSYILFNEINKKQYISYIYLTKVLVIVNKLHNGLDRIVVTDLPDVNEDIKNKIEGELSIIQKKFRRRPADAIALHFDLITDVLWEDESNYTLVNAIESMCNNFKNNLTIDNILSDDDRFIIQVCAKRYNLFYEAVQDAIIGDFDSAKESLNNLVDFLKYGGDEDVSNIFDFFDKRKDLTSALKTNIKYADDLSIPIYIQYLQTSLRHYGIVLSFLTGGNWWDELRFLYDGKYAKVFFDSAEHGLEVADDVLGNLDRIHLVRLLRDINVNDTTSFCLPNVTLSDYAPDKTGVLSTLKQQICDVDPEDMVAELPMMVIVSQGFDNSLALPKVVNYTSLEQNLNTIETKLQLIRNGTKSPTMPAWINKEDLDRLRSTAKRLLSKEMLTKLSFGVLSNVVDASTLFLKNSHCTVCSTLTTWFKQLNLQLYKKQEYDTLLCHLHNMPLHEVYVKLKEDFHWDMSLREIISTRNYTKLELNKSVNEFLEQVKLHLLEDLTSNRTKLTECLAHNVSRNMFGNATLFVSVLSHSLKLLRAQVPHLQEIEGMTLVQSLKQLSLDISPRLHVTKPLKDIFKEKADLGRLGEEEWLAKADVDLVELKYNPEDITRWLNLRNCTWDSICDTHNCTGMAELISANIDDKWLNDELQALQLSEFWRFTFVSNIIRHVETCLHHVARMLAVASRVDVMAALEGKLAAILDFVLQIVQDDSLKAILYSLQGITDELIPLLIHSPLQEDMRHLARGLAILADFRVYLIEHGDLKLKVSELFSKPERLEHELAALGINNTNFWSLAAPRIQAGNIDLKPLLTKKQEEYRISNFVCQPDYMSLVILPDNVDVVTYDDVYYAIAEQFCSLDDERAKRILPALVDSANYSFVIDKVLNVILQQVYLSANISQEAGENVLSKYPQMLSLLPIVQENVGGLRQSLMNDPLFDALKNFTSLNGLLSSSEFLASAGNMMCGKPFVGNSNRFYKAIAATQDFDKQPDPMQLDVLPTDFCRSLYKDVLSMGGGKIIWSFVKPLLMGRVLYTPDTPAVHKIIEKANSSFSQAAKLASIIHNFASSFPSINKMADHKDGARALSTFIGSAGVRGNVSGGGVDVDGLFDQFEDLEGVGDLLSKASSLLHCINLNRFQPAGSEDQLAHDAAQLTRVNEFAAGVVFTDIIEKSHRPISVTYKIRMDIDTVPTTSRVRNQFWTPGPEADFLENMRYFRGFVQIQDLLDQAIIQLSETQTQSGSHTLTRMKRDISKDVETAVYTQQMPYPCYRKDFFQSSLYESQALIVAFFFSMVFSVASAIRFNVAEKESGITMLMSVMGVRMSRHTLSWWFWSLVEMCASMACVSAVLSTALLPRSEPALLLLLLIDYCLAIAMFCYMITKLFRSASLASLCGGLLFMITFMPYVIILSLEAVISNTAKIITCLSLSTSFSYALLHIARYEAIGRGAQWSDLWTSADDDVTLGTTMIMLLVDAALYCAIGMIVDRFYGFKTLKSNITYTKTTKEKAGVSIVNVTKIYNEGTSRAKVALDQVSIELQQGQITTLLGHNGAGKTTLINIITGMSKPTRGHIVIRTPSGGNDSIGVCPQKDVLFDALTPREHLTLYAQLKSGGSSEEVREEVENMLTALSLHQHASVAAMRLSGGLRRRLCVGAAFLCSPALVLLDEPQAGLHPAAHREIWSLILKLKAERTVLLTTHHLEEAEFLSDQIVIMHKGQVHTTGTPIEIKRSLGNGYKLTLTYPSTSGSGDDDERVLSIDERSEVALLTIREVIGNAQLVDVEGTQVEVMLPFFDSHGVNNDFLKLCTSLESKQEWLGLKSFSLDCDSLEQVMTNITNAQEFGTMSSTSTETATKTSSLSSDKTDHSPLVPSEGALRASDWVQLKALLYKRYLHYKRNTWLLFLLLVLPSLFVSVAMGFSMIRPPADNEVALPLTPALYTGATQFVVPKPSVHQDLDPSYAEDVLRVLMESNPYRNWTTKDNPRCNCSSIRQECDYRGYNSEFPAMMAVPDVHTLNQWLVTSQEAYIEKRYGGFSSSITNNRTNLIAWYNNKGHHALPSFINALNTARLKKAANEEQAAILAYTHPLKISPEQLSKSTLLQHVADAGISGMLLLAYSIIPAGAAVYLVQERSTQQRRLQYLSGVTPTVYWASAAIWDIGIILVNIAITVCVLCAFGFPVFVARDNLPAICLLLFLFGFSCSALVHYGARFSRDASLCTMLAFCCNVFAGVSGLAILLILDIISESEATDNARWVLHKIFLLSPQFALGDALLEIAKNTVQAQVLSRFGMETYKSPLWSDLLTIHYTALIVMGVFFTALNLAQEYGFMEYLVNKFYSSQAAPPTDVKEEASVLSERQRVENAVRGPQYHITTIGNINAGFINDYSTDSSKKNSMKRYISSSGDVIQCLDICKTYATGKQALNNLTFGIPPGQCTALVGENGAGKSTTFSILTGELRPTRGQLYLCGVPASARDLCSGLISYCPQINSIDPLLTVRETLQFYCMLRGIDNQQHVINKTLESFELSQYASVNSAALSGGNKRKLCAAVAFMSRAKAVLLDEPTSGMDAASAARVWSLARSCAHSRAILLATHTLPPAARASRLLVLHQARARQVADRGVDGLDASYIIWCRVGASCDGAVPLCRRLLALAPHAALLALHPRQLQCRVPRRYNVDGKEMITKLSDIVALLAELQARCDLEDYTLNLSTLDHMLSNYSENTLTEQQLLLQLEEHPTPSDSRDTHELDTVTAL